MTKTFPGQRVPMPNLYDKICDLIFLDWQFKRKILELLNLKGLETIADIGCGSGRLLGLIQKRYPKTKLVGIDPDEQWTNLAKNKAPGIKFIVGEGAHIPLKTKSIDVTICTLTLHHMDDANKHATLKEIKRITRRGGRVVIADIDRPRTLFHQFVVWMLMFVENPNYIKINLEGNLPTLLQKQHFPNIKPIGRHQFVTIWQVKK